MAEKRIEETLLEKKKDLVIGMDVAYTLACNRPHVPNTTITQVSHTLLSSCLKYYKAVRANGINHVRITVKGQTGTPKEILGDKYVRFAAFCGNVILAADYSVSAEEISKRFELGGAHVISNECPELYDIGEYSTTRDIVKKMSEIYHL